MILEECKTILDRCSGELKSALNGSSNGYSQTHIVQAGGIDLGADMEADAIDDAQAQYGRTVKACQNILNYVLCPATSESHADWPVNQPRFIVSGQALQFSLPEGNPKQIDLRGAEFILEDAIRQVAQGWQESRDGQCYERRCVTDTEYKTVSLLLKQLAVGYDLIERGDDLSYPTAQVRTIRVKKKLLDTIFENEKLGAWQSATRATVGR